MFKRYSVYFLLFCIIFLFGSVSAEAAYRVQPTEEPVVIVIDPGHGGENLGTIENGFEEKQMTLLTAQAMYDELCLYDNVKVYMTRTEDVELSLAARAEYAASLEADFLFSVHYNASVEHDLFGAEVWISATQPYNAYGYQFGTVHQEAMRDMGLYLRGVKTKLNDKGTDYYGIIRECVDRFVPAVIIEHCHVDEERDYVFCDTEEEQIAFGKADATAVAKYFGLKSEALGVDYSEESNLPEVEKEQLVKSTLTDETAPDICIIEMAKTDENTGTITLNVTATDYDSTLIYYDYSYDGGRTYSPLQIWPGSDVLTGDYRDTIQISFRVPSGTQPDMILRAYNMFDAFTESNRITSIRTLLYHDGESSEDNGILDDQSDDIIAKEDKTLPGTETFRPAVNEETITEDEEVSFGDFLKICLVLVIGMFVLLFVSRLLVSWQRRKRRRQRRKLAGESRNHPR